MKLKDLQLVIFLVKGLVCLSATVGARVSHTDIVYAKEGELVALRCPLSDSGSNSSIIWKVNTSQGFQELRKKNGSLLRQRNRTLLILRVEKKDSAMYTCLLRNGNGTVVQAWSNLEVLSNTCIREVDVYLGSCFVGKSCSFASKSNNDIPLPKIGIRWFKNCQTDIFSTDKDIYFDVVAKNDAGNYTCKHDFEFEGQRYYTSTTTKLVVSDYHFPLQPKIIKPQHNDVFQVNIGKPAAVQCLVLLDNGTRTDFMELHWINGSSMVSEDKTLSVFYNSSLERVWGTSYLSSWLVFKNVSESHLNTTYTCKLESTLPERINVSITLEKKAWPGGQKSLTLCLSLVVFCVVSVVVVTFICYKMRIYIVLFLRDLWGAPSSPSDGKRYDAYISYYKTCSDEALTEEEITLLLDTMETKYGFQLCIYHRNVLPGGAVVDAVLEHVKQSRRLVLVPSDHGPQPEDQYGLWNGLHAALVERHTRLVLIQRASGNSLKSLPEPLSMLARGGHAVTWKGSRSAHHSSAFWKHLLYHMPPRRRQQEDKMTLL
ncbi:interleukin-18 receptor 1-like [Arapaima gigas]